MRTEETYQIYGDYLLFEFAPGGDEGRDYFKLIIKDGYLWVDSAFLYRPPYLGVSVDGIPIPDQIARQVIKTVFPLSKWDIEQQQYLMLDGPHLELLCSDWGGRGVWLRSPYFCHEAAWEVVNTVYELCPLTEIDRHRGTLLFQKTEMNEEGPEELQRICKEVLTNNTINSNEWSAPIMVSPGEIKERMRSMDQFKRKLVSC